MSQDEDEMSQDEASEFLATIIQNGQAVHLINCLNLTAHRSESALKNAIANLVYPSRLQVKLGAFNFHTDKNKSADTSSFEKYKGLMGYLNSAVKAKSDAVEFAGLVVDHLKKLDFPLFSVGSPSHESTLTIYDGNISGETTTSGTDMDTSSQDSDMDSSVQPPADMVNMDGESNGKTEEKKGRVSGAEKRKANGFNDTKKKKKKKKKKKNNGKTSEPPEPLFSSYVESTPEDYQKQKQNMEQFMNEDMFSHTRGILDPVFEVEGCSKNKSTIFVKEIKLDGLKKTEQIQWFSELKKRAKQSPLSLCELIHIFALYAFDKLKMKSTKRTASYWFKSALGYAPQTKTQRITFRN